MLVSVPPVQLPAPDVSVHVTLQLDKVTFAELKVKAILATSMVPVLLTLNISLYVSVHTDALLKVRIVLDVEEFPPVVRVTYLLPPEVDVLATVLVPELTIPEPDTVMPFVINRIESTLTLVLLLLPLPVGVQFESVTIAWIPNVRTVPLAEVFEPLLSVIAVPEIPVIRLGVPPTFIPLPVTDIPIARPEVLFNVIVRLPLLHELSLIVLVI